MWKLNRATAALTNKAGLWKSKDTWNLIPLEKEIFNSSFSHKMLKLKTILYFY